MEKKDIMVCDQIYLTLYPPRGGVLLIGGALPPMYHERAKYRLIHGGSLLVARKGGGGGSLPKRTTCDHDCFLTYYYHYSRALSCGSYVWQGPGLRLA